MGLGEGTEFERADRDADEAVDFEIEGFEEAADVAVFAFVEEDFKLGVALALAEGVDAFDAESVSFGRGDAREHLGQLLRGGMAGDLDVVGLVEMGRGVGDGIGPLSVVGEEEQAFAGLVEPADGDDAGQVWDGAEALEHGAAALFVRFGDDEAGGFVEHEVDESLARDGLAIDFDARLGEIETSVRIAFHAAVEADAPSLNDLKGLGTGAVAELRQRASQADRGARHVVSIC